MIRLSACAGLYLGVVGSAHAQWSVIDIPALVQLVQQVQTVEQQLQTAKSQLQQAQQTLQAMSGGRGMQSLQSGLTRNYLPTDWKSLSGLLQNSATSYAALSATIQQLVAGNAILPDALLSRMAPADRQHLLSERQFVATNQAVYQSALTNSSGRFAVIQGLIDAIGSAQDQKGILDLQARIAAELGMLMNEQTKLQVLAQSIAAQQGADLERQTEAVVAGHGQFDQRFQPTP